MIKWAWCMGEMGSSAHGLGIEWCFRGQSSPGLRKYPADHVAPHGPSRIYPGVVRLPSSRWLLVV
jgi:hypothetical protein